MSFETITDILQIIFADIILSGDNALVIGMAAAGLAPEFRRRAIMIGMKTAMAKQVFVNRQVRVTWTGPKKGM